MPAKIHYIRSFDFLDEDSEGNYDIFKSNSILSELATSDIHPKDFDFILDFRSTQIKLSTFEIFSLASELTKKEIIYKHKVAVLFLPGLEFNRDEFAKLATYNDWIDVEVFTNYEDAVDWIYF